MTTKTQQRRQAIDDNQSADATLDFSDLFDQVMDDANGGIDYGEAAEAIVHGFTPDEFTEFARPLVVAAVRERLRNHIAQYRPPAISRKTSGRSARWDNVKEVRDRLDEWWVAFTDRESKPLLDCSASDLDEAAEWYAKRAAGYQARAGAYQTLASEIRKARKSCAAELSREKVRRILDA